jgi:peptidoglycan/LPS O-acetylase OafA/YrhL
VTLWSGSLGTILAVLFGMYPLQSSQSNASDVVHALFFAMQRNSWGIAIAWIVFSCSMGYGGIIKSFLELPIWIPLGRMSLSFYLVHGLYYSIHIGSKRIPHKFDDFELVIQFLT